MLKLEAEYAAKPGDQFLSASLRKHSAKWPAAEKIAAGAYQASKNCLDAIDNPETKAALQNAFDQMTQSIENQKQVLQRPRRGKPHRRESANDAFLLAADLH